MQRFKFFIIRRVVGDSMLPALTPDTLVIAIRPRQPKVGDVVIVHHDGLEKIKRVKHLGPNGIFVAGDNLAASTDSRTFGWLPPKAVIARVIWPKRVNPKSQAPNPK